MIDVTKINTFVIDYYAGKFPNQRLGQAFCNHFNISDNIYNLFYKTDNQESELIIYSYFADYND